MAQWLERSLIVRWVIESIPYGGPVELCPVPASSPRLAYQRLWYVLFVLWNGANKRFLAAGFDSHYRLCPTPI